MLEFINDNRVGVIQGESRYPNSAVNPAFHPSTQYPEYPFQEISIEKNSVYDAVRQLFYELGFDKERYGSSQWNPLGELIRPGDNVVLKPNFVRHHHRLGKPIECVITHGSVIRAIMDYAWIALQGKGEIVVADAPQGDADFKKLISVNGVNTLFEYYQQKATSDLIIELRDLRKEWTVYRHGGVIWERVKLQGDPHGYTTVPLDQDSEYVHAKNKNYYGADYDRDRTRQFHNDKQNRYNVAQTILNADVFISIPKLKVHRKVGVTLNIKNLIGINGEKNYLPHFTIGSPGKGGDEFSNDTFNNKIDRKLKDFLLWKHHSWGKYLYVAWHGVDKFILRKFQSKQNFVKGDWWGNDTTWRSAVDLTKVILYADRNGIMHQTPQRRYFSIIDGIIGGEGEGPLTPDPVNSGLIIGGANPLLVDIASSTIIGVDWKKVQMLANAVRLHKYAISSVMPEDIQWHSNSGYKGDTPLFQFQLPAGWVGHVEIEKVSD
ncbi:MAG: DUF362 domain-containing protein [Armatimonadetes bacterium]|nr:DUF362 domain-containing protein [Armatimonadota bacterium]